MKYSCEQSAAQGMLGDDRITLTKYWQPVPVPIRLTYNYCWVLDGFLTLLMKNMMSEISRVYIKGSS